MTSGGNNFICFAENQLAKFSARDAGDFNDAAGEWEMAPKCGSLAPARCGRLGRSVPSLGALTMLTGKQVSSV